MKLENVPSIVREKIKTQLQKKGIPPEKINPRFLSVRKAGPKLKIKYKGFEFSMRSPSQKAVDSWWDFTGKAIVGALLTLAGVAVGAIVVSKKNSA